MKRTWSINGRFLTQPVTGVQRYAREIVSEFDQLLSEGHPLTRGVHLDLIVPKGASQIPTFNAIQLRRTGRMPGHLWEQIVLPALAGNGLISLCNTGPLTSTKHIICIHDATTRAFPQSYSLAFRTLYRVLQPVLGRKAAMVATVSRFSGAELTRYGIVSGKKIPVAPNGHEHALRWKPEHTPVTRAAAGPSTVVVVGGLAPHKNIGLLVALAPRLKSAGIRIAVAGLSSSRVFNTAGLESDPNDLIWLGRLSDGALAALLQDSLCLAFPSLIEGFGLPPLEAMALGCPVVASDTASMPEICGDAVLYAPPTDPERWYDQILRLYQDSGLRQELARAGRARARQFSWRTSALTYLAMMAKADGVIGDKDAATTFATGS